MLSASLPLHANTPSSVYFLLLHLQYVLTVQSFYVGSLYAVLQYDHGLTRTTVFPPSPSFLSDLL